jgi:hypothetical protein
MSQAQQYLDSVANRLSTAGFAVKRGIQSDKYRFEMVVASPSLSVYRGHTRNAKVILASLIEINSPDQVADFSSFVMKYVLDNKRELRVGGGDLSTVAVMVAESFNDEMKKWVSETTPNRSVLKDRFEFPVLVETRSRQIFYFRKKPFVAGTEYKDLRAFVDEYLGF